MSQIGEVFDSGQKRKVDGNDVVVPNKKQSPSEPLIVDFTSTITGYKCPTCFENVVVIGEIEEIVEKLIEHVRSERGATQNIEISIDGDHMVMEMGENNKLKLAKVVSGTAGSDMIRIPAQSIPKEAEGVLAHIPLPHGRNQIVLRRERYPPTSIQNLDAMKDSRRVYTTYFFLEEEEIQVNYETNVQENYEEFDLEQPSELDIGVHLELATYIKIGFAKTLSAFAQKTAEFKDVLSRSRARTVVIWCLDVECTTNCLSFLPNGKNWGWEADAESLLEGLHLLTNFSHVANTEDAVSVILLETIMDHRNVEELFIEFGDVFDYEKYLREWVSHLRSIVVWKVNVHGQTNSTDDERIVQRRSRNGRIEKLKFYCRVGPKVTEIRMFLMGVYDRDNEDYDMPNTVYTNGEKENYDPIDEYSIS